MKKQRFVSTLTMKPKLGSGWNLHLDANDFEGCKKDHENLILFYDGAFKGNLEMVGVGGVIVCLKEPQELKYP